MSNDLVRWCKPEAVKAPVKFLCCKTKLSSTFPNLKWLYKALVELFLTTKSPSPETLSTTPGKTNSYEAVAGSIISVPKDDELPGSNGKVNTPA